MDNESYTFVHTHSPIASVITRIAARAAQVPVVYTAHGFHFYKGGPISSWLIYYPIEYILSKSTHTLITINEEDFALAKKHFKPKHLNRVFGVGISTKRFMLEGFDKEAYKEQLGLPKNSFVVLSVGELSERKNHQVIIKALSALQYDNVYYLIAGKGECADYLSDLANRYGIKSRVLFLGYRQDIPELCNVADVFAFPSIREGLGLACLEAMSAGIPAVAADTSGPREYIVPGKTGYLCDYNDEKAFAEALNKLINNRDKIVEMGQNARKMAMRYDISLANDVMTKVYSQFVSEEGYNG